MPSEPISAEDRVRNEIRDSGAPASSLMSPEDAVRIAEEHAAAAVDYATRVVHGPELRGPSVVRISRAISSLETIGATVGVVMYFDYWLQALVLDMRAHIGGIVRERDEALAEVARLKEVLNAE